MDAYRYVDVSFGPAQVDGALDSRQPGLFNTLASRSPFSFNVSPKHSESFAHTRVTWRVTEPDLSTFFRSQANICYAIFDTKPGPNEGRLAGMISLINSSQADLITELGWVLV